MDFEVAPSVAPILRYPLLASLTDCGSCCGITLSTTSSVVVDRSSRKAVMPVRGCQKRGMVRKVTGRLIRATRLPLRMGSSNNSSWSMVIEEMFGGQH